MHMLHTCIYITSSHECIKHHLHVVLGYCRRGFLSVYAYCKISKKVCAKIFGALKYQYEIDHTHVYWWARVIKDEWSLCAHGVISRKTAIRKKTRFCLTDKPLIALYMALGYLDGYCTYFLVLKPGRQYALIFQCVLKSWVHLKACAYGIKLK